MHQSRTRTKHIHKENRLKDTCPNAHSAHLWIVEIWVSFLHNFLSFFKSSRLSLCFFYKQKERRKKKMFFCKCWFFEVFTLWGGITSHSPCFFEPRCFSEQVGISALGAMAHPSPLVLPLSQVTDPIPPFQMV